MKEVRLSIIGNYALQFLERSLIKSARKRGLNVLLHTADYGTCDAELIEPESSLYRHAPSFIFWHESTLTVRDHFFHSDPGERVFFAERYVDRLRNHLMTLAERLPDCRVIFPNHSIGFEDHVFGNYGHRLESSWHFQSQKLDYLLNDLAARTENLLVMNSRPSADFGEITDYALAVTADLHFTLPYLDWLSRHAVQMIESQQGRFHKCLVMDLDNTIWGGVIGDDGMEGIQIGTLGIGKAFTRLQLWIRELGNRGIILAVCSKNEENIAREPFERHPEMILKLDDIAVFVANWESKSDNIARIREILNIGFDSMVFIDDNPAERDIVRRHLPEVTVPELPEDPALYLPFLCGMNLFETATYDKTDQDRTKQYQQESQRQQLAGRVTNMEEFLNSLEMKGKITPFLETDVERLSQLSLRSNQFNLRTIRYQVPEIRRLLHDPSVETFSVTLSDKFGQYGLISMAIVRVQPDGEAYIDTWIMSCRVLKRKVEMWLLNHIAARLKARGVKRLTGTYLPTEKNKIIADLLPKLGFKHLSDTHYELVLDSYTDLLTNIKTNEHNDQ
jgi:FkbH-like protein